MIDHPRTARRLAAAILALSGVSTFIVPSVQAADSASPITVSAASFRCMTSMTKVRGFYVDNLLGKLNDTLAVAKSAEGGAYPPGTVLQLVPTEVMVKQPPGTSPATKDWEFFELDVSAAGSTIRKRGFVDVVNRFGGNCFGCHAAAKPQWDLVCEETHGCAPIPITAAMFDALQVSDPRCVPPNPLTQAHKDALAALDKILHPAPAGAAPAK